MVPGYHPGPLDQDPPLVKWFTSSPGPHPVPDPGMQTEPDHIYEREPENLICFGVSQVFPESIEARGLPASSRDLAARRGTAIPPPFLNGSPHWGGLCGLVGLPAVGGVGSLVLEISFVSQPGAAGLRVPVGG